MNRKKIKKYKGNSLIVLLLIASLSCQSIPVTTDQSVDTIALIRENLPPDEETLAELEEASALARSYRQQLVSSGLPNFSFNDWQIASLLYDQTTLMERSGTLRETQESIARYNLTAIILETLYLSATNDMPIGGGVVYFDGDDMYWDFVENDAALRPQIAAETPDSPEVISYAAEDPPVVTTSPEIITAAAEIPPIEIPESAAPAPVVPIITVAAAQIPVLENPPSERRRARTRQEQETVAVVTEETRQPGRGIFIPDTPSREELKTELITAAIETGDYTLNEPATTSSQESIFAIEEVNTVQQRVPVPPVTPVPVTQLPPPVTPAPVTPAPVTPTQETQVPVTSAPVMQTPVTPAPVTPTQETQVPVTLTPDTPVSETQTQTAQIQETELQPETQIQTTQPATQPATQTAPVTEQTPTIRTASRYPAQYRVISWELYGDCLWNIAGLMYNDPRKWRIIYEANKHIMPDPDNPDLIVPDMILTIPSIEGEIREGLWDGSMGKP